MSNLHILSRFTLAAGILALTACTQEVEIIEEAPSHQPLRIATAATPLAVNPALDKQEMINTYTLVYVNTDTRRVEAIQNFDKGTDAVEYDVASFPIEISEQGGTDLHRYKVYAFANFTDVMKGEVKFDDDHTLSGLTEGTVLDAAYQDNISSATLDLTALNGHVFNGDYIPMTAVVDYDATMQYHQPVNVPLVRMLTKLKFQVRNMTCGENPLRLQKISIRPVQNAPVYLLPHLEGQAPGFYPARPAADKDEYGMAGSATNPGVDAVSYVPVLPLLHKNVETDEYEAALLPDTTHVTLDLTITDDQCVEIPKDGSLVDVGFIYVNESLAKWHPTGHFTYDLYFYDSFDDPGNDYVAPREFRYALSEDDFTAFLRNDEVTIPLNITSPSSLQPEVIFYPPIGGYPPVIKDKKDDEFYATFGTGGEFAIDPQIFREGKRTDIRLTDTDDVVFNAATNITVTMVDDTPDDPADDVTLDKFFKKAPKYVKVDNTINATLGGVSGHAIITLTIKMKDSGQIVTKKMHIIKQ